MPRVQFHLMFAGHRAAMPITTSPHAAETTDPHPRVRSDLRAAGLLLAIVIGGNLLWRASDAGLVSAIAGR
jgi:hypothetical protein